jgi:hypothetical protein
MRGPKEWVPSVAFSPNGSYIASLSEDGTIRRRPEQVSEFDLRDKLTSNISRAQWREWDAPESEIRYEGVCPRLREPPD